MHFLCLHGAGTNNRIFELQTAALRYDLGGGHTYDFVEGVVSYPKAHGVESLAAPDEAYFAYYKPYCAESFTAAVTDLEKYIETDGPFDGIIAFSQGASLAAALIGNNEQNHKCNIRCAVFLSGRLPFIDAGVQPSSEIQDTTPVSRDVAIDVPTVHIWGATDDVEPGQGESLANLCRPDIRYIHVHSGGHEVPGPRDKEGFVESVNAIRCMLAHVVDLC